MTLVFDPVEYLATPLSFSPLSPRPLGLPRPSATIAVDCRQRLTLYSLDILPPKKQANPEIAIKTLSLPHVALCRLHFWF